MQHNSTVGDRIFEAVRVPALIFLLLFSFLQAFAADAHEIELVSPHTGKQAIVDISTPITPVADIAVSRVAVDWREGMYCPIDRVTIAWLHEIVKELAAQGLTEGTPVVYVYSGFRSLATNRKVGGVKNSQHLKCKALDISIEGVSIKKVYQAAKKTQRGGLGYYPAKKFIHIDSGRVRQWYQPINSLTN